MKSDKKRKSRSTAKGNGSIPAFLLKTYEILENPIYSDIISWNREGNAFVVKKVNEFSETILPKYFKHNNFASFVRQLNMYDFHKTRHENNENEFRHKLFRKGYKHLLSEIKRKTAETTPGTTTPNTQIMPFTGVKENDVERVKKEYTCFAQELISLRTKQEDSEGVIKKLSYQNNQILEWNRLLWNEIKSRIEKHEKRENEFKELIFQLFNVFAIYASSSQDKNAPEAIEDRHLSPVIPGQAVSNISGLPSGIGINAGNGDTNTGVTLPGGLNSPDAASTLKTSTNNTAGSRNISDLQHNTNALISYGNANGANNKVMKDQKKIFKKLMKLLDSTDSDNSLGSSFKMFDESIGSNKPVPGDLFHPFDELMKEAGQQPRLTNNQRNQILNSLLTKRRRQRRPTKGLDPPGDYPVTGPQEPMPKLEDIRLDKDMGGLPNNLSLFRDYSGVLPDLEDHMKEEKGPGTYSPQLTLSPMMSHADKPSPLDSQNGGFNIMGTPSRGNSEYMGGGPGAHMAGIQKYNQMGPEYPPNYFMNPSSVISSPANGLQNSTNKDTHVGNGVGMNINSYFDFPPGNNASNQGMNAANSTYQMNMHGGNQGMSPSPYGAGMNDGFNLNMPSPYAYDDLVPKKL